jgi:carbonic anhydrase
MTVAETLRERNAAFAIRLSEPPSAIPKLKTLVVTCADPRVDPSHVLGLELGEAAVIRNIAGRITPATLQAVAMMATVVAQYDASGGFELIVLQHTDCGIKRLAEYDDLMASYFDVPVAELPTKHITDPHQATAADVAALRANPAMPADLVISGLVYDVETGRVSTPEPADPS